MAKDVKITPTSGYIQFLDTNGDNYAILSGDATNDEGRITLGMPASGVQILNNNVTDSVFSVFGDEGTLFNVSDDLSDSLMSVNDAAGLPVFEVFADDVVIAGEYNQNDLVVSGNNVGVGTPIPDTKLHVAGKIKVATLDTDATLTDFVVVDGAGEMHKRTSGAKGAQGSQGSQGAKGATGSQGAKGDKGQKGATGSQGSQGGTGAKGATGSQGAGGATGAQGAQGAQGAGGGTGAKGATGAQGAQGAGGGTGSKGQKGATGSGGGSGSKGQKGATGSSGSQGSKGQKGASGGVSNTVPSPYYLDFYTTSPYNPSTSYGRLYGSGYATLPYWKSYSSSYTVYVYSDERLKENVSAVDKSSASAWVKGTPVYNFTFREDSGGVDCVELYGEGYSKYIPRIGFLAHEVIENITIDGKSPNNLAGGERNAVDEEGKVLGQQVDEGRMVPILWAALQDVIDRTETLEAKVAALES